MLSPSTTSASSAVNHAAFLDYVEGYNTHNRRFDGLLQLGVTQGILHPAARNPQDEVVGFAIPCVVASKYMSRGTVLSVMRTVRGLIEDRVKLVELGHRNWDRTHEALTSRPRGKMIEALVGMADPKLAGPIGYISVDIFQQYGRMERFFGYLTVLEAALYLHRSEARHEVLDTAANMIELSRSWHPEIRATLRYMGEELE